MKQISRKNIAEEISKELLYYDILDIHNFSCDTKALVDCVQEIILKHLQDYIIITGDIL